MRIDPEWLRPTWFIDSDSPAVAQFARQTAGTERDPIRVAERLFLAVRDGIRYDPYAAAADPSSYRASTIAASESNWCIPKSVLFVAAARNRGIPARLGFADVRNHLTTAKLSESMGTDLFAWHGYAELLLDERWVKLSTAFNIELCRKFGVKVLEFDAVNGSLMHPYDERGQRHMEYVNERGSYNDLPLTEIFTTFAKVYPNWELDGEGGARQRKDDQRDQAFDA